MIAWWCFFRACALSITFVVANSMSVIPVTQKRPLPPRLLIGYTKNCSERVKEAVRNGVNVVIWSFFEMVHDGTEEPTIRTNLDLECVRRLMAELDEEGFGDTVHMASFGGWNGPHLDTSFSASQIFRTWLELGGDMFHGIDWDLEGNDNLQSEWNCFSKACLDTMGEMSVLAQSEGFCIGIAPPQSYLDVSSTHFSRKVNLTHSYNAEHDDHWHSDFQYAGKNVYAYLLAKYQQSIDFVSVQFYESYSRAAFSIRKRGIRPAAYLENYVMSLALSAGDFFVDFEQDKDVHLVSQNVQLPLSKLVLGFANGWADGEKAIYMEPTTDVKEAYESLKRSGHSPRGCMFWTIDEEAQDFRFTRGLNEVLQIREGSC